MELGAAARLNILETYRSLALQVPGTTFDSRAGFHLVRGPADLFFCNYAAGFNLGPGTEDAVVASITEQARGQRRLSIFLISGDQPADLERRFRRHGFECINELRQMSSCAVPPLADVDIREALTEPDRRSAGEFMVGVFFPWTEGVTKRRIVEAMVGSSHRLFTSHDRHVTTGVVMVVETEGATGLYSLGVDEAHRGRGIGADLVRHIQHVAAERGTPVTLQCSGLLTSWYRDLGFADFGFVRALHFRPE